MSKRLVTLITTVLMLTVFTVSQAQGITVSSTTTTTIGPAPAAPNQIIMSDGRICNPRWGC